MHDIVNAYLVTIEKWKIIYINHLPHNTYTKCMLLNINIVLDFILVEEINRSGLMHPTIKLFDRYQWHESNFTRLLASLIAQKKTCTLYQIKLHDYTIKHNCNHSNAEPHTYIPYIYSVSTTYYTELYTLAHT